MQYTLSVLVKNHPGVLTRVAGLFNRRAFNIDSLAVGITDSPDISRMTIVVSGDEAMTEQICRQVEKLIDVIGVTKLPDNGFVGRELALIKVRCGGAQRGEIMQLTQVFRASIVDVSQDALMIELTGDGDKIQALANVLRPYGILEMVRSGSIALARGGAPGV